MTNLYYDSSFSLRCRDAYMEGYEAYTAGRAAITPYDSLICATYHAYRFKWLSGWLKAEADSLVDYGDIPY